MKFRQLVSLAALTAVPAMLASVVCAQTLPTGPIRLELRLKAGQTYGFRITSDTVMKATLPNGEAKTTTTHNVATFDMTVERENPDGSYAVRVKGTGQELTSDGDDVAVPDSEPDVTATLGRDGKFSNLSAPKADKENKGMSPSDFMNTLFDEEAGYPTKPLAIGESWKIKVSSPIDETQPKMTVNNKLLTLDVVDGKPVARILQIVAEPIQNPNPQPGITMTGSMEGGGLSSLDLATGLVADERDTMRVKLDVTAQNPDNASQKVQLGSEANVKVRIQGITSDRS